MTPASSNNKNDTPGSGGIDLADASFTLSFLFLGEEKSIPPPFPAPGIDPTDDGLGCLVRAR